MMFETRSIGIDFGPRSVKVAVASSQGGRSKILELVEKPIPESPEEEKKRLISAAIRETFAENGFNGDQCVIALPAAKSINRLLVTPLTEIGKIRQTLKFQMEPQIPYPVDQVVSDFVPGRRTNEGLEILTLAVTKDILSERLDLLRDADVDPQIVTLDSLALVDFYVNQYDFSPEKITALLCLEPGHSFLGFFRNDRIISYRNLEAVPLGDGVAQQKMAKEVQRTIISQQTAGTGEEIGTICIAGPDAEDYRTLLQEKFPETPVRVIEFNNSNIVEIPPYLLGGAEECRLAIALAYTGLGNSRNAVNFRRDEFAPASLLSRIKPNVYFSLAILGVALLAWFGNLTSSNRYHTKQLNQLNQEMIKTFETSLPGVKTPDDVQQKIRQEQEKFRLLRNYSSEYVPPLDVLAEVSANIPQGKTLTMSDLAISDYTLRMTGDADSFDDINVFRDKLDNSLLLSEVKIESATKADKSNKINFRIRANVGRKASTQTEAAGNGT